MKKNASVAGTGFSGRGGIIRKHCKLGQNVILKRDLHNNHDDNAISVHIEVPILFGLLGTSKKNIGFIKAGTAKSIAKKIDSGVRLTAVVDSLWAPPHADHPRVSIEISDKE